MKTHGHIRGIIANLLMVEASDPVAQNEICLIELDGVELMGEVIKIHGTTAFVQVFDSTRGVKVGTEVIFTGGLLEVSLGPGILSKNYDGLQNDLDGLDGLFLNRGDRCDAIDSSAEWAYRPDAEVGATVEAGDWLGSVDERGLVHRIMVPFHLNGSWTLTQHVSEGTYRADHTIATIEQNGKEHAVSMIQRWPVKIPLRKFSNKPRPHRLLETGVRTIDSLNPMLEGGVGFIPGPFGCGKTVLQHAISKQAEADVVIMAACGERANEVVEIFKEFPELEDPRTGKKLMERTIIIANTSNMPVAAREASVYTAMTLAEYYRQMGLKVLLLADSTSRWAQALREMSNRLEDLPGPDAFPMDLSAIISNFYARAGRVELSNGAFGSITFIGTVSPAGGNLKEPVTESTKKATRCYYALSQKRADGKRYPAIDPIQSYSKYLEYPEFIQYSVENIHSDYTHQIQKMKNLLQRGGESSDQINILGDDGVPLTYHVHFWRAELIDFVILQQDAFDAVDQMTPMKRQIEMVNEVLTICERDFHFDHFEEVGKLFKRLINDFKQLNYTPYESDEYGKRLAAIQESVRFEFEPTNA